MRIICVIVALSKKLLWSRISFHSIMFGFIKFGNSLRLGIFKLTWVDNFSIIVITLHDTEVWAYFLKHSIAYMWRIVLITFFSDFVKSFWLTEGFHPFFLFRRKTLAFLHVMLLRLNKTWCPILVLLQDIKMCSKLQWEMWPYYG